MVYREFRVNNTYRGIISNYWKFEVSKTSSSGFPIEHETLPENTISLVFINQPFYQGIRLLGPHTKSYTQQIFPDAIFLGIKFHPWIVIPELVGNKSLIVNQTIETPEKVKLLFTSLDIECLKVGYENTELLDAHLNNLLKQVSIEINNLVKFVCLKLEEGVAISTITKQIPASTRVIQRQFKTTTGLTMKQYAKVHRQRETWKDLVINNRNAIDAILDNGFYDQSHFINQCRMMMKRSPNEFKDYLNSVEMTFD